MWAALKRVMIIGGVRCFEDLNKAVEIPSEESKNTPTFTVSVSN
jgi:hypothetical protein